MIKDSVSQKFVIHITKGVAIRHSPDLADGTKWSEYRQTA
jgi:hypothetical protein